jgi:hypothetical protein
MIDGVGEQECVGHCGTSPCPDGEICYPTGYPDIWGCFPGGPDPLGARCEYPTNCERGLVCSHDGVTGTSMGTCTPYCTPFACAEGDACAFVSDCEVGLSCAILRQTDAGWTGQCVASCASADPEQPALCDTGEVCFFVSEGTSERGCYPGGPVAEGMPCATLADCERGTVCWFLTDESTCVRACNTDDDCVGTCAGGLCQ